MHLPNGSWFSKRRRHLLGALGLSVGGLLPAGSTRGEAAGYVLVQGERCIPLTPLSGGEPVEAFYGYQLPGGNWTGENGARDDGGPYFGSTGTRDLQVRDASLLFLYEGPEGLSLVVLHDSLGSSPEGGGSATFAFAGLPGDGEWVVKDDFYLDPGTGEPAATNYDRWDVGGTDQAITWTWDEGGTDGGAFRGLDGEFAVEIDAAFDGAAARLEKHYEGRVTEWQALSGDPANPDRHSLDLDRPVTIRPGSCGGTNQGTTRQQQGTTQRRTRTKHERKRRKHEKKRQQKHERKQNKHERKRTKHERKQQKHERKRNKHERKRRKHERKQNKHEKD